MNLVTTPPAKDRSGPTLDTLSESQIAAIRAIPAHEEHDVPALDESRPANIFLDPVRFDLEQEKVFLVLPVPITMSAVIPKPGDIVATDSYGKNIIVARDKDGVVRAFLNACTHKGAKLVEDGEPKLAGRLVCPYQAQSAPSCDFGQVGERFGNVAFGIDDGNHRRGQFAPS